MADYGWLHVRRNRMCLAFEFPYFCRKKPVNENVILSEETLTAPVVVDSSSLPPVDTTPQAASATGPAYVVLSSISLSHFLNDTMQSLIPSVYPILKDNYALDFAQIGFITLTFQCTASLLQPFVGHITDKRPFPYSMALGMGFTLFGLVLFSAAHSYAVLLIAAALVGFGSAIFHPEAARIARLASGGRYGFAHSFFQVGGNFGSAMGPVLAALIVVPFGQPSIAWFSVMAFVTMLILWRVGIWYKPRIVSRSVAAAQKPAKVLSRTHITFVIALLIVLVFSKFIYISSLTSFYTFYLMHKFGVSTQNSQLYLFLFLGAIAAGTFFGGPIGDRIGRRYVIWFSLLGALPFTLMLPHVDLFWTAVLSVVIGFILASAMPAIMVYAQELMPHRVGMVSGLFFGFAFGAAGIGAAMLGEVADRMGIDFVYQVCAFLPALGLLAVFLPNVKRAKA